MNPISPTIPHHPAPSTWGLLGVTSSLIFIADLALPLGVAGGVPYILVVLLRLQPKNPLSNRSLPRAGGALICPTPGHHTSFLFTA
jgi:hypothetical protein